jgi:hypothetical protein
LLAKLKVQEAGEKAKESLKNKYDEKIINIGDNVRMLSLPTKVGLKIKLRGDLWTGPFKVVGKLANGNVKLNIYKRGDVNRKRPYITHPERLKLAEEEYLPVPFATKKKSILKTVRFEDKVVIPTAKTFLVKTVRFGIFKHRDAVVTNKRNVRFSDSIVYM